jgi:hypothetical protein
MRSRALLLGGALLLSAGAASAQTPAPLAPVPLQAPAPPPPPPSYASQPFAPPRHQSTGTMIAGIVLTSLGSALLVASVSLAACCNQQDSDGVSLGGTVGVILGLSSILPAAVGIPLWVVGARAPPGPVPMSLQVVPAVSGGPGGLTLRWTF